MEKVLRRRSRRRSAVEGPMERVCKRGSDREGSMEKVRQRRSHIEDPLENVRRRRFAGEDGCRKRGLTLEPTIVALIPCEMREEKNTFLY